MANTPFGLSADPMATMATLMKLLMEPSPAADFSPLEQRQKDYAAQAQQANLQLNSQLASPPAQVDPRAQFVMRATAGAADSLTGGNQLGTANEDIKQQNMQLVQDRIVRLSRLEKLYSENADRAAQLGDKLAEAKALEKVNGLAKQREQALELVKVSQQQAQLNETRSNNSRQAGLEQQRIDQEGRRISLMDASKDLPASTRWLLDSKDRRIQSLEEQRNRLGGNRDAKGNIDLKGDALKRYNNLTKQIDKLTVEMEGILSAASGKSKAAVSAPKKPADEVISALSASGKLPADYATFAKQAKEMADVGDIVEGGLSAYIQAGRKFYASKNAPQPSYQDIPGLGDQIGPTLDVLRRFMLLDPSAADTLNVGGPGSGGFIVPRF